MNNMKTIQNVKGDIKKRTKEFWKLPSEVNHKSLMGRDCLKAIYGDIQELKEDLAMLKDIERDGFVRGVNAFCLDSVVASQMKNVDRHVVSVCLIKKYDKGLLNDPER